MAAPSWQEYYDTGKAEAIIRRPDLTFTGGDITEMLMAGAAAMADHLTGYAARRFKATFLDGAKRTDLTALSDDHWAVQRKPAVFATGETTWTRAATTTSGTIVAGTVVATDKDVFGNEVQFVTDAPATVNIGVASVTIPVTAMQTGPSGNVAAGTVTRITSQVFDTFTVTNADRMAGGADEETDDDLRERVRALPKALRRGTLDAIEYGALQVASVKRATATEDRDSYNNKTGIVSLFVSDVNGGSSTAMLDDVRTELVAWEAAGIIVNVFGGVLRPEPVAVSLTVRSGVDTNVIAASVQDAIVARVAKLKIGEDLTADIIKQAALNVDLANITKVVVTTPATTVEAASNELIRVDGTPAVS